MNAKRAAMRIFAESEGAREIREQHELEQQWGQPSVVPDNRSLHQQLLAAGVELDSHESDLYAKVTPESTAILERAGQRPSTFRNPEGDLWYDIPFAYEPFWKRKEQHNPRPNASRAAARIATRYDSGITVDYTCDDCGDRVKSMALPDGWMEEGDSHTCQNCSNKGQAAGERCALCGTFMPGGSVEMAIDEGWIPSFWIDDDSEDGPACGKCVKEHLTADPDDGEFVLKPASKNLAP